MLLWINYVHVIKFGINLMSKKHVIYMLRTYNHCLKTILTLKTQFERKHYDIFWDILICTT
jgi:hypothetical protein